MKSLFFCLSLAVWPALGGTVTVSAVPAAPIALYVDFQQTPPRTVLDAVEEEVENIMTPAGMRLEWRSLAGVHGNEVSAELAVVRFKGRCDIANLNLHPPEGGALGWTHISDGVVLPFSDVDCGKIRAFLQSGLLAVPAKLREEVFGRAVGRVLAHELYHIFAKTQHHGSQGVAKPAYTVRDLLSNEFVFEERQSDELRNGQPHPLPDVINLTR